MGRKSYELYFYVPSTTLAGVLGIEAGELLKRVDTSPIEVLNGFLDRGSVVETTVKVPPAYYDFYHRVTDMARKMVIGEQLHIIVSRRLMKELKPVNYITLGRKWRAEVLFTTTAFFAFYFSLGDEDRKVISTYQKLRRFASETYGVGVRGLKLAEIMKRSATLPIDSPVLMHIKVHEDVYGFIRESFPCLSLRDIFILSMARLATSKEFPVSDYVRAYSKGILGLFEVYISDLKERIAEIEYDYNLFKRIERIPEELLAEGVPPEAVDEVLLHRYALPRSDAEYVKRKYLALLTKTEVDQLSLLDFIARGE